MNDVTKLPKWAQERIAALEGELAEARGVTSRSDGPFIAVRSTGMTRHETRFAADYVSCKANGVSVAMLPTRSYDRVGGVRLSFSATDSDRIAAVVPHSSGSIHIVSLAQGDEKK